MRSFTQFVSESSALRSYLQMLVSMSGGRYRHPAALILTYGRSYPMTDTSYDGPREPQRQCFRNAGRRALQDSTLTYVEGYIAMHQVPLAHAWVVDRRQQVIDPTLIHGRGLDGYYGLPIRTDYLRHTILKTKVWGLFDVMSNPDILTDDPTDIIQRR